MNRTNIVLVGFMGTGKTSVGKKLAASLGKTFVDMDEIIVEREGKPVSKIFEEDGESKFRALERALVQELAGKPNLVIATGGGIVLNPKNIEDFSATGFVVCLHAEPETILKRLKGDRTRPLLASTDKMERIINLLEARRPLYDSIPDRVDTTTLNRQAVVDHILTLYGASYHRES